MGWVLLGHDGGCEGVLGLRDAGRVTCPHAIVSPHPLTCCDAPSPGSHAGVVGSQLPRASVSLHHRPFLPPRGLPQEAMAHPGSRPALCPGRVAGKPMSLRRGHQPRRATRNTSCIDRGAAIQRGEALPGESLSHRCPPPPVPHSRTPRHGLYKYGHRTPRREGREGSGKRRRAAGGAGVRAGDGSPGLGASSAGLCLACAREGMLGRSPAPQPRSGGLDPASPRAAAGGRHCPSAEPRRPRGGSRASRGAQTCVCIRLCRGRLGSEFWEDDWEWWEEDAEALLALSNCT